MNTPTIKDRTYPFNADAIFPYIESLKPGDKFELYGTPNDHTFFSEAIRALQVRFDLKLAMTTYNEDMDTNCAVLEVLPREAPEPVPANNRYFYRVDAEGYPVSCVTCQSIAPVNDADECEFCNEAETMPILSEAADMQREDHFPLAAILNHINTAANLIVDRVTNRRADLNAAIIERERDKQDLKSLRALCLGEKGDNNDK